MTMVISEARTDEISHLKDETAEMPVAEEGLQNESLALRLEAVSAVVKKIKEEYCYGADDAENKSNRRDLSEITRYIQFVEAHLEQADFPVKYPTRNDFLKHVQNHLNQLEVLVANLEKKLRRETEALLVQIGVGSIETNTQFKRLLNEKGDPEKVLEMARVADQQMKERRNGEAQWVGKYSQYAKERIASPERKAAYQLLGEFFVKPVLERKTALEKKLLAAGEPFDYEKTFHILSGVPGVGKSHTFTSDSLSFLEDGKLDDSEIAALAQDPSKALELQVSVDADQVRPILWEILKGQGLIPFDELGIPRDPLINGVDVVESLKEEVKEVIRIIIEEAQKHELAILYQGTMQNKDKILKMLEKAQENGYRSEITFCHYKSPPDRITSRSRKVPWLWYVSTLSSYPFFESLRTSTDPAVQVLIDKFKVVSTDFGTPKLILEQFSGLDPRPTENEALLQSYWDMIKYCQRITTAAK